MPRHDQQAEIDAIRAMVEADLNSGEPWSDLALSDLRWCIENKQPTAEIASFLCRSPQEVIEKAKELGYDLPQTIEKRR